MFTDQCEQVGMAASDLPTSDKLEAYGTVFDIIAEENANITAAQKELLLWHFCLGHAGMGWVQTLMHNCKAAHGTKAYSPILPTKHDKAKSCDKPCCEVCLLGKQHQQTPGSVTVKAKPEKEMAIRQDNLIPGDCISLNQFESSARKRLPHTFGKETSSIHYVGELLGIDQSSGYVFLRNQVSLRSGNIVRSMREFEKEALQCGVKFKKFHADNFPFNSEEFKAHVQDRPQTFSGVGAHQCK